MCNAMMIHDLNFDFAAVPLSLKILSGRYRGNHKV